MTTYYKGYFFIKDKFPLIKVKGRFVNLKEDYINDKVSMPKIKLNSDENDVLLNFAIEIRNNKGLGKYTLNNLDKKINKLMYNTLLIQIINYKKYHVIEVEDDKGITWYDWIIYEKVYDKYGRAYAKEMFTDCIFPLIDENDINFTFSYKLTDSLFSIYYKLNGNFCPTILNRQNFDRCECFMMEDKVANNNNIKEYKSLRFERSPEEEIEHLYNMNVFDESIIIDNQSQSNFDQNSNSYINTTTQNNENRSAIKSESNVDGQSHNTRAPKVSLVKPNSTSIKKEILENIKDFILLLPQQEINLLNDMTNNNLNDPNILEYLRMPRDEKIKFLDNKKHNTYH